MPQLEQAREQARQKMLALIKGEAEKGDWRAAARHLELSYPADYRQAGTKVEVTASAQHANVVVVTEEQRQRLIEQRERLLAGRKAEPATALEEPKTPAQSADRSKAEGTSHVPFWEPLGTSDDEPPMWEGEGP
jgi:hypothetical protein